MTEAPESVQQEALAEGIDLSRLEGAMLASYKAALPHRLSDPERLEALYGSRFWRAPQTEKLREFCALASSILKCPIAQVNLVTEQDQRVVAAVGNAKAGDINGLDWSYCQHVVGAERNMTITDAREHTLVCDSRAANEGGIRSYLGVPLLGKNGLVLGTICVADYVPRKWTAFEVTWLTQIASAVVTFHEADDGQG